MGEKIRLARRNKGWSLEILSKETGLSKSTLADIENGNIDMPLSRLAVLGYVLEMQDDRLMSEVFKLLAEYGNDTPRCLAYPESDIGSYHFQTPMNGMNIYAEKKRTRIVQFHPHERPDKEDDAYFEEYINKNVNQDKKRLLLQTYDFIKASGMIPDRDLQTTARAACRYAINDGDKITKK